MTEHAARNAEVIIRKHLQEVAKQPSGFFTHFPHNPYCDCDNWEECGHIGSFHSVVYRLDDNLNYLSCEVTVAIVPTLIELHTAESMLISYFGCGIFKRPIRVPVPKHITAEVDAYFENELSEARYNN
ncbi:MAG: hypothetical protein OXI24_12235 [Candidatus Poribacteria bacterium]|nr:hypothetical protein [Candidatus Poribacteria bacterium]